MAHLDGRIIEQSPDSCVGFSGRGDNRRSRRSSSSKPRSREDTLLEHRRHLVEVRGRPLICSVTKIAVVTRDGIGDIVAVMIEQKDRLSGTE